MLRINGRTCQCGERLELEGRLTREYVPELGKAVAEARSRSARVSLDVSELTFVDVDGAQALRELRRQAVEVHGCSAFVAELLGLNPSTERPRGGPCWT
jgi:ABC-type transporter Mla MlaB component